MWRIGDNTIMKLLDHPFLFSQFTLVVNHMLNNDTRVVILFDFPVTIGDFELFEERLSKHFVRHHPRLPNAFFLTWTPYGSSQHEVKSLLALQPQGIILVDFDSYLNVSRDHEAVHIVVNATRIHLKPDGYFVAVTQNKAS